MASVSGKRATGAAAMLGHCAHCSVQADALIKCFLQRARSMTIHTCKKSKTSSIGKGGEGIWMVGGAALKTRGSCAGHPRPATISPQG